MDPKLLLAKSREINKLIKLSPAKFSRGQKPVSLGADHLTFEGVGGWFMVCKIFFF